MELLKVILYAVLSFFIAAAVHELGHIVTGLVNRWRLFLLVLGPFKLYRESPEAKIRFGIEKNPLYWGGVGGTFPTRKDDKNIDVYSKILLGGPVASVVFGVIIVALFVFTKIDFFMMLGFVSLGMGAANLIPSKMRTGMMYSDGTRYRRIRSKGKAGAEEKEVWEISEKFSLYGNDTVIEEADCRNLLESDDVILRYYALFSLYSSAKAGGKKEKAEKYRSKISEIEDKVPKSVKEMFDYEKV